MLPFSFSPTRNIRLEYKGVIVFARAESGFSWQFRRDSKHVFYPSRTCARELGFCVGVSRIRSWLWVWSPSPVHTPVLLPFRSTVPVMEVGVKLQNVQPYPVFTPTRSLRGNHSLMEGGKGGALPPVNEPRSLLPCPCLSPPSPPIHPLSPPTPPTQARLCEVDVALYFTSPNTCSRLPSLPLPLPPVHIPPAPTLTTTHVDY